MPDRATTRYVGLDVHAQSIAVALADPDGQVHAYGTIPNTPEAVRTLMQRLGRQGHPLAVCYEAGPMGYGLYRQLHALDIHCDVIAPSLIPTAAGDRIKTDRRDALKLARWYRSGDLTTVWVPDAAHEALRDLVRAREDALEDRTRARQRLSKFLLRHGLPCPTGMTPWTQRHRHWLDTLPTQPRFQNATLRLTLSEYQQEVDHGTERLARYDTAIAAAVPAAAPELQAVIAALQCLRGVKFLTAVTLVTEIGQFLRFPHPRQLMAYAGLVPKEHSSGARIWRGGITKCGSSHLRRIVVEAACMYRHGPHVGEALRRRQRDQSATVRAIAWKAQRRLCDRYQTLRQHKKPPQTIIGAIARELLGFIWAIAVEVERTELATRDHAQHAAVRSAA